MEQKDIDIYEILKKEEVGVELYTPKCGKVWYSGKARDKDSAKAIWTKDESRREHCFDKNGKIYKEGEVLLFPSKEMRDWSKFFKYGDVLVNEDGDAHVIFEGFDDDTYETFNGNNYLWKNEGITMCFGEYEDELPTSDFSKANKEDAQKYIRQIEERLGGKLNLETLEIEKLAKPTFEIGKLYVFNEEDEDGELTIIGKLIGKNESEDTLTFGNQYEIENEKFVTDQTFDMRISVNKELREATELEVEIFNKHFALWKKEKEEMEHPAFKVFDKVLVRSGDNCKWFPALFVRDRGENSAKRYTALPIHIGTAADFTSCIPYEGHENIAFTDYDIENLPF